MPKRTNLRRESEEPILVSSRIDKWVPSAGFNTAKEEPSLVKLRRENELPTTCMLRTESDEPNRAKLRRDMEAPK